MHRPLGRTSTEDIRRQLSERIISGALPPDAVLDETQLAAEFSVSRTPVREALKLLAASGLVRQTPHGRTRVARPDAADLRGMFELMGHLEALSAELSARRMSAAARNRLDALHQDMAVMVCEGDVQAYIRANEAFHEAIYAGAQNAYLEEVTKSTRQRLQPFRRAQFSGLNRLARSHAEHGHIVEAILRGEAEEAGRRMADHILIVEDAWNEFAGG